MYYRIVSGVLVAAVLLGLSGVARTEETSGEAVSGKEESQVLVVDPRAVSDLTAEICEKIAPSVVTITSTSTVEAPAMPFDLWGFGFGFPGWGGQPREYTRQGLGSGVVIDKDGLIVTNNHVVGDSEELRVAFSDGEEVDAKLVGTDPKSDLALVRVDVDHPLTAVVMGDSDDLRVGEWVLAIGSPFSLSQTVTQGIVSFIGREGLGLADYEDYIQTDAAINPGNSGGALVNLDGELIGINTAIASRSGGNQGIGFAIPVNTVRRVIDDLLEFGEVRRGWLGVVIQEIDADLAEQFGLENTRGVLVSEVVTDTPADAAGLRRGDVIISVNGGTFDSASEFRNTIADMPPGAEAVLSVVRDGHSRDITVKIGFRRDDPRIAAEEMENEYGWRLGELTDDLEVRLGASGVSGVVVMDTVPGGRASASGVQPGDVVVEINHQPVHTVSEAQEVLSKSVGDILLLIWRRGRTVYYVF